VPTGSSLPFLKKAPSAIQLLRLYDGEPMCAREAVQTRRSCGQREGQGAAASGAAPSILRALAARQGFAACGRPPPYHGSLALARGGP
jgi:hypothetical protein